MSWASGFAATSSPNCDLLYIEISENDFEKATSGKYELTLNNKDEPVLTKRDYVEQLEDELAERVNLKTKLKNGTASDNDIKRALELLL